MFDRSQGVETTSQIPPIRNPIDLQEALEEDRTALLALGELIKTARLTDFDRDHFLKGTIAYTIADDAQYGLSKLINLCIDSQKRIVDSYVSRYMNGDEQLLKDAESIFETVKQGAFEPDRTKKELNRAVDFAERVASHGGGLADKAEALVASIFNHDLFRLCQTSNGDLMQSAPPPHHEVDEVAAQNKDLQSKQPAIKVFCGVQALSRRLEMLVRITDDKLAAGEIIAMVGELGLLDAVLKRLQFDRDLLDESDIDQAIDRLRRGPEGGA